MFILPIQYISVTYILYLGDSKRVILNLQNISHDVITPKVSKPHQDPEFTCHIARGVKLWPEQLLMIPVTFKPKPLGNAFKTVLPQENFTISYKTTERVITVRGTPVEPQLVVKPEFRVCRYKG